MNFHQKISTPCQARITVPHCETHLADVMLLRDAWNVELLKFCVCMFVHGACTHKHLYWMVQREAAMFVQQHLYKNPLLLTIVIYIIIIITRNGNRNYFVNTQPTMTIIYAWLTARNIGCNQSRQSTFIHIHNAGIIFRSSVTPFHQSAKNNKVVRLRACVTVKF